MPDFTEEVSAMIALLEQENRLMRARNERLEKELEELQRRYDARDRIWKGLNDTGESD